MPKKRKDTAPTIDEILETLCHRDAIEPLQMDAYLERLDEEWLLGARDKVLSLLRRRDPAAHSTAVYILSHLATEDDREVLEDFVTDPTVSDLAKLTLAPVLRELNSELAEEGLVEYLNDPEAAMLQMQSRLLELVGKSELGVEAVLEDVLSMPLERRLGFVDWLGRSHDPRAVHLLLPLLENQSTRVVMAAIDALEQLGSLAAPQAIPALNHLLSTSSNRLLKQHARAALGRLTMQATPGTEAQALADAARPTYPLYEARVSFIDGSGSQIIMLAWKHSEETVKGINLLCQDQWGIKDCYSTDEMTVDRWQRLVREMSDQGFTNFAVPPAYCLALIAEAVTLNRRGRHKLPIAYAIWRPLLTAEMQQHQGQPIPTALDPQPFTPELLPLVQKGDELFRWPEFASWMYEPLERIQPFMARYWGTIEFPQVPSASSRGRGRSDKQSQRATTDQRQALETVVEQALEELIDDHWRHLYERRLRRQGQLFAFAGRQQEVALIRAVAAALHPSSGLPLKEQPFVRAFLSLSIRQGPFRLLLETLDSDELQPLPGDLFPPR
ncbi:MAG: HEAT repeat domain-containing protein [Thermogemmatispora sp.]|uniref:HEAT repeat domain-containing protein n=1 Tax=Thermogemmatispora sp. TaxID=1968838 RepID=UPI001D512AB1|nr:HEAT repeat domain-containing protein [Thermogemmatispora sp.]MBX5451589.1 HEAT repeat domain-containing protein [Thermogemmatispora sp.]